MIPDDANRRIDSGWTWVMEVIQGYPDEESRVMQCFKCHEAMCIVDSNLRASKLAVECCDGLSSKKFVATTWW